jgi:DNA-binding FadR family transcriptional regulator
MAAIDAACTEMGAAEVFDIRIEADIRFHMGILIAARNEFLLPFGFLIESSLVALFDYVTRQTQNNQVAQRLHEAIAAAIRRRQPEAARRAVLKLLENTDEVIRRTARSLGKRKRVKKSAPAR